MHSILNLNSQGSLYSDDSYLGKVRDRFKITYEGEHFIKDINLSITNIRIPPNVYPKCYGNNIKVAKRIMGVNHPKLSIDVWRMLDYYKFSEYQKKLFAFSVVQSIKFFLKLNLKNISNSCIAVLDAEDYINEVIIKELCKHCNYVVLLSKNLKLLTLKREYLIANYGVAPIITRDYGYILNNADFIISSRDIDPNNCKCNIWYINNKYIPSNNHNVDINDMVFKVPWEDQKSKKNSLKYNIQMTGAILNYIGGNNVEEDLKACDIFIEKFGFNI